MGNWEIGQNTGTRNFTVEKEGHWEVDIPVPQSPWEGLFLKCVKFWVLLTCSPGSRYSYCSFRKTKTKNIPSRDAEVGSWYLTGDTERSERYVKQFNIWSSYPWQYLDPLMTHVKLTSS